MAERPMLGGCCVCLDERGWAENPLVYCDGQSCNVAVHQACYGIIKVPSGPWFCRKCESQERAAKVKCDLCPHRDGALKRTDSAGWAHVVCALYIPEVTFGSVSSMEPIILQKVPSDRFSKLCYICEDESRTSKATTGACMTCAKLGCKVSFHVTCAQMSGLLCEEASGGNQTKYCGYCHSHLMKGKKASSVHRNSSSKLQKLSSTSDEVALVERNRPATASMMKPGDIRYTKAGKKRSKSLEDSITTHSTEAPVHSSNNIVAPMQLPIDTDQSSDIQQMDAMEEQRISSNSVNTQITDLNHDDDMAASEAVANVSSNNHVVRTEIEPSPGLSLLSSLAEAAHFVVHASAEEDSGRMKMQVHTAKEYTHKRQKDHKKRHRGSQVAKRKKNMVPLSGFLLSPPELPSLATKDPMPDHGTALYPRHNVVSLESMGASCNEAYEAHEIGDNNRIHKQDLLVDGVTALEKIQEQQLKEGIDFFYQHLGSSNVSALMGSVRRVREDNRQLECAIQQISLRKNQLLLIKSKLLGLQAINFDAETVTLDQTTGEKNKIPQDQPPDRRCEMPSAMLKAADEKLSN